MNIQQAEELITITWPVTDTKTGCAAFIDYFGRAEAQERMANNDDVYELIYQARNLAFAKGNLLSLEAVNESV